MVERNPRIGPISSFLRVMFCLALFAPLSFFYMALCVVFLPFRNLRIHLGNLYGKMLGPTVLWLMKIKWNIVHRPKIASSHPALFVSNHASTADMWVGMWLCPFGGCGVGKKEIVRLPIFGQVYWLSGHLLLDRGNRARAIASMDRARVVVEKNKLSLWMWPEGTRSKDGSLQRFKKGFVHMALATGLPVVPVLLHDADLIWPKGSMRPVPSTLRIEVLDPIDTSSWDAEHITEQAEEVRQVMRAALGERQKGEE